MILRIVLIAAVVFAAMSYFDRPNSQTQIYQEPGYSLQEIINALQNAEDASGVVNMVGVNQYLENPSAPTQRNNSSLEKFIEAVKTCDAEGELTYANFTEKYTK